MGIYTVRDGHLPFLQNSDVNTTKGNRWGLHRTQVSGEEGSAMAGASGSSRLPPRETTKAFQTDSHLPSSSKSGNVSPDRIPSLKFPFLWEPKNTHRISRGAEQRAALITLGAASIIPEKKLGRFLSEEVKNIDLFLPLAYEITRTMILRQFGAAQLALQRQCWSKIVETIVHKVRVL